MSLRLLAAIISIIIQEAAIAAIVLFGLPQIGVRLSLPVLIVLMLAWLAVSVVIYRAGSRALRKKPVPGFSGMLESKGKVVKPLDREGLVKIKDELWLAKSEDKSTIEAGEEVVVVGQDGLKLVVRKVEPKDLNDTG